VLVGEGVPERAAAVAATASHKVFAQRGGLVGCSGIAPEALDGRWGQLQQLVALVGAHTSPRAPRLLGASETQEGALGKGDWQLGSGKTELQLLARFRPTLLAAVYHHDVNEGPALRDRAKAQDAGLLHRRRAIPGHGRALRPALGGGTTGQSSRSKEEEEPQQG
jgi:hypothetical protein